ncbi:TetR/AcrR family transcriptional regulator [Alicyclobacillus acidiphilus]|uniref:TetR/AcrR family transcriptional regulator n=1 Tax=Alicyclobacillus acidiphilus TaxID=182455 RepID=UPI0009FAE544|nr:TetR/AcrR family transcriptional regulator [Alicyclobacillus acidiphilus]
MQENHEESETVRSEEDRERHTGTRRRGDVLEADILRAAWDELQAVGYTRLTMEGVAARAKTSKAVIYRRWPNRAELILSALRLRGPILSGEVPNTGSLRGDVLALLRRAEARLQEAGIETIHGLIAEVINSDSPPEFWRDRKGFMEIMEVILKRAAERGEVDLDRVTPRVMTLPIDLIRYEVMVANQPLSERVMTEIVDDIFLPLVGYRVMG